MSLRKDWMNGLQMWIFKVLLLFLYITSQKLQLSYNPGGLAASSDTALFTKLRFRTGFSIQFPARVGGVVMFTVFTRRCLANVCKYWRISISNKKVLNETYV